MNASEMFGVLERLIESAKVAILANVDETTAPRMRWMTPATIRGSEGLIYALTAPDFDKTAQLVNNDRVEWMLQSQELAEVLRVRGRVAIIDNPSLKSDVEEALGGRLGTFWRVNPDASNMVVLETVIEEFVYYKPMEDEKLSVRIESK